MATKSPTILMNWPIHRRTKRRSSSTCRAVNKVEIGIVSAAIRRSSRTEGDGSITTWKKPPSAFVVRLSIEVSLWNAGQTVRENATAGILRQISGDGVRYSQRERLDYFLI